MRFLNGCIYKAMLFYKMENELNQLEKELLCQSPKEILKSAYELTFKRELLLLFGESSTDFLTEDIIRQLYGLEYPLQALYLAWLKEDSSELEMLRFFVGAYCQDSFKASQNRQAEEQTAIDEERYELIEVYGQRALFMVCITMTSEKATVFGHTSLPSSPMCVLILQAQSLPASRSISVLTGALSWTAKPNRIFSASYVRQFSIRFRGIITSMIFTA